MNVRGAASVLGAGILAVALGGCVKVDLQVDVETNDTVNGSMIIAYTQEMIDMMGGDVEDLFGTALPDDTTAEPYEDGDFVGAKYTITEEPLSSFDSGDDSAWLSIDHEGDEFVLTGVLDLTESVTGDLQNLEGIPEGSADDLDVRIGVTFPGEVIEHNGDLGGTTVTWVPQLGDKIQFNARAEDSGGADGMSVWAWLLIALAIVVFLIGALFYFSRSRSKPTDPYPPPPGAPGSYPPPPATDIARSSIETPMSSAEAGAEETAEAMRATHRPTGTPLGAEESEANAQPATPPPAPETRPANPETPPADHGPPPPPPPA